MFTSFNCGGKIKRIFHRISFSNANAYMIQTNIPDFTRGYISPIKHSISSLESARCLFSWVMNGHKSSVYIRGCGDLAIINEFHCYQGRLYGGSMFTKFPYLSSEYFKAFYIMHVFKRKLNREICIKLKIDNMHCCKRSCKKGIFFFNNGNMTTLFYLNI